MRERATYEDHDLMTDIRDGGLARERAMAFLYRSHVGAMVAFIRRQGGDEEVARDIFQDAVVQLLTAVEDETFQGQSTLRTYLFAVGKRMWYTQIRRQQTEQRYLDTLSPAEQRIMEQTPERRLAQSHEQEMVQRVLEQLGERCQEVLTLWSMKYAMREIAEKVGYANEQIARNKKTKCLKSLKELVRVSPALRTLVQEMVNA